MRSGRGSEGALVRGSADAAIRPVDAEVRSTLGAGDVLVAVVLAKLALSGWEIETLVPAVEEGVAAAARVTEVWGAVPS